MPTINEVIKHLQGWDGETVCAFDVWLPADVEEIAPDLTPEQIDEVLESVDHNKDCTLGITWTTLEYHADRVRSGS